MAQGPDDGDEEELVEIELEIDGPEIDIPPPPPPPRRRTGEVTSTGAEAVPEGVPEAFPEDVPKPFDERFDQSFDQSFDQTFDHGFADVFVTEGEAIPEPVAEGASGEVSNTAPEMLPEVLPDLVPDIIEEARQPLAEAAALEPAVERALYEGEAEAATAPVRQAVLLDERARLAEHAEEGLAVARRAFVASPGLTPVMWALASRLARAGLAQPERWEDLAATYTTAAAASPVARADLLVERGRLLEDRLGRDADAVASYREALVVEPAHAGALLGLLLAGARLRDHAVTGAALEGLAGRCDDPTRRGALAIAAGRAWRASGPELGGAARALEILDGELRRAEGATPVAALLIELDTLTDVAAGDVPTDVATRALDELARRSAPVAPGLAVALRREQARLLRRSGAPDAALTALDQAAALDPGHALVAVERMELAAALSRDDVVDGLARDAIAAAPSDDAAVDLALLHAEIATRAGRGAAARASLETPRVAAQQPVRPDLRAFALAGATLERDAVALADGLEDEAAALASSPGIAADVLVAAGAIRQWRLGDAAAAEGCYRRALAAMPGHQSALRALAGLLPPAERGDELAALLEDAVAVAAAEGQGGDSHELWLRSTLVAVWAHELGDPGRALPHQRRLVALLSTALGSPSADSAAPGVAASDADLLAARARLHDLELAAGIEDPENVLALAAAAGDPAVATALKVDAGRGLLVGATAEAVARGRTLLSEVAASDASRLAGAALEQGAESDDARLAIVTAELAAASADTPADVVRALRFRLAHHHAAAGRYAEAMAALTPLRSLGDPLARAWSYELARRSGEAILEVAVLFEETNALDQVLGPEVEVLLAHGEALVRAGDPHGAADAFRRALALAPTGDTAPDAALALFRIAAADPRAPASAVPEALRALAAACADDGSVAAAAAREEALARLAVGPALPEDLPAAAPDGPSEEAPKDASTIVRHLLAGMRRRDHGAVGAALLEIAAAAGAGADPTPLLVRALCRSRAGGVAAADAIARRIWRRSQSSAFSPSISDLPTPDGGAWPATRPDPRRPRARRIGGALATALDLEAALDAERRGALATALSTYGGVIATEPDRLEAWTGIRRVARAGGDVAGEARALARLGALVRDLNAAAALLGEAATAFEQAGRIDDAITTLAKAVELKPSDAATYTRVHDLLRADLSAPGRADIFDALLSHRLAVVSLGAAPRVALLYERAQHRLQRLRDRAGAFQDFKEILNVLPEHREALYQLARGAFEDGDHAMATPWYERYLAIAGDDSRAAEARLELATSYEKLDERVRAIETLRKAAVARPGDPKPLHRMAELYLRTGEWRPAIEALRASEPRMAEATARAALHVRIGTTLRDLARDAPGAAAAFRRATELDPLGDGTRALVSLYEAVGDKTGALETVEREIIEVRRTLAADPLNVPLLARLREYLALAQTRGSKWPVAAGDTAAAAVQQIIQSRPATLEAAAATALPMEPLVPKGGPGSGRAFWTELAHPAATGFISEIWPNLLEAAEALFPPPARDRRAAAPVDPAHPQLVWITATATAMGLTNLGIQVARAPGGPVATPLEEAGNPILLLSPALTSSAADRFHVGRALGILLQHATVLERASAEQIAPLFASAAVVAGVPPPAGLPTPTEEALRAASRSIGRKDRKALALQASRFGFEAFDLASWHEAVLRTADRLGLMMAGDVALAAVTLAASGRQGAPATTSAAAQVAASPAALDVVRFALGERYPVLRQAVEEGAR
jgi:tetratricopeptide (TPR) repeat protein